MKRLLLLVCLLLPLSAAAQSRTNAEKQRFWTRFRAAVLSGDPQAVARLTRFPLQTRGQLDGMSIVRVSRAQFPRVWARLMGQPTGLSVDESQHAYIARTPVLSARELGELPARMSVVGLEFARVAGQWRLTFAYTEDTE